MTYRPFSTKSPPAMSAELESTCLRTTDMASASGSEIKIPPSRMLVFSHWSILNFVAVYHEERRRLHDRGRERDIRFSSYIEIRFMTQSNSVESQLHKRIIYEDNEKESTMLSR